MKRTGRNEKGFTLMELMMVISIVIVITSLSIYNLMAELPGYRLRSTANKIAATLQYLKIRAVTTNRLAWLEVNYDTSGREFFTGYVDIDASGGLPAASEVASTNLDPPDEVGGVTCFRLPPTISFGFPDGYTSGTGPDGTAFPGAGRYITTWTAGGTDTKGYIGYRPTGVPVINPTSNSTPGVPMVIYLTNIDNEGYAVSVQITGRVRVWHWSNGGWF